MCHSRMTTIATIAAAVSFGSRRLMKSTFRPTLIPMACKLSGTASSVS
jgi:hypothetical protein